MREKEPVFPIHGVPQNLRSNAFVVGESMEESGGAEIEEDVLWDEDAIQKQKTKAKTRERILLRTAISKIAESDVREKTLEELLQIERTPLLTREEEIQYAQAVQVEDFLKIHHEGKSTRKTAADVVQQLHDGCKLLFQHIPPQPPDTKEGILAAIEQSHKEYPASLLLTVAKTQPLLLEQKGGKKKLKDAADMLGDQQIRPASVAALTLPPLLVEAYAEALAAHNPHIIISALNAIPVTEVTRHFERIETAAVIGREQLVLRTRRLVLSVAARYVQFGVPLPDLMQRGIIGLEKAIDKYEYRKGNKFGTYAYWWIQKEVRAAIAKEGTNILIPQHTREAMGDYSSTVIQLEQTLGRPPTDEEIAAAMNKTIDQVQSIQSNFQKTGTISLSAPIGDNENLTVESQLADTTRHGDPQQVLDSVAVRDDIDDVLDAVLTKEQAAAVRLHFGLEDGRERTFPEIGEELGVSRKTASKYVHDALTKLRQGAARAALQEHR